MEFMILGPLEVRAAGQIVNIAGGRQERVLAALLLAPNRSVGVDQLVDVVWDGSPPASGRRQIQNAISLLRGLLGRLAGKHALQARGNGYQLTVEPEACDLQRFDVLVTEATELGARDPLGATSTLRTALGLWRGPALDGLTGAYFERHSAALAEKRLMAVEDCLALEMDQGRHRQLIGELTSLVAEYPLREGLVSQLMLALYRSGRQADALRAYQRVAHDLREELGVDPGPDLRRLHQAILREDAALIPAPARPPRPPPPQPHTALIVAGALPPHADGYIPDPLPANAPNVLDHVRQLSEPDSRPSTADHDRASAGGLVAISGGAAVGKTLVALHRGHRVWQHFPDGPLYLDLRGDRSTPPMQPIEALGRLLRALGVAPDHISSDVDEAAVLFRSCIAGRRMLVVLDNARQVDQVRPFLPTSPGCLTIVTSRYQLGGLVTRDSAKVLAMEGVALDDAIELLTAIVGRTEAVPEHAAPP